MNFNIKAKNIEWWLFIILFILNFFPFYIALSAFIPIFIFLLAKGKIHYKLLYQRKSTLLFTIFASYSLIISLIYNNWPGVAMSLFYFILILYFSYYYERAPSDLFEELINICMIASLFIFAYTLLEYFEIVAEWDYSFIHPRINSNHANRVEASFFNPNYYAMVLEFLIMMGMYKLFTSKTQWHQSFYLFIILANFLALIFTANRTAPIVVILAIIVFFYVVAFRKTALFIALVLLTTLAIFVLSGHYPRLENLSWAIEDRMYIWQTALNGIRDYFIFGQGPYTYTRIFDDYGGKFTYHAHNIYLDILLNYGIVGSFILACPLVQYIKKLVSIHNYPALKYKAALLWSFVAIFLVHGLTDMSIYWFQTMLIFFAIMLLMPRLIQEEELKMK